MLLKTAFRFTFSKGHSQRRLSVSILVGIAIGLCALIVVIGVMNSLQNSQLSRLRDAQCYDITVASTSLSEEEIASTEGVLTAFRYKDVDAMLLNERNEAVSYIKLRGIVPALYESRRFSDRVHFYGNISFENGFTAVGSSLASTASLYTGSEFKLTFLKKGSSSRYLPYTGTLKTTSIYYAYSDLSSTTCFTDLDTLISLCGDESTEIGIYCDSDRNLEAVVKKLKSLDPQIELMTYKQSESVLYTALMTEKAMVEFFLFFIIVIVCFNLKKSVSRMIVNRKKETAVLRALGLTSTKTFILFNLQSLIIAVLGISLGTVMALLISNNINGIFALADRVVSLFGSSVYLSSYVFDVSIKTSEVVIFDAAILVMSILFTLMGTRRIGRLNIMEIIRDE